MAGETQILYALMFHAGSRRERWQTEFIGVYTSLAIAQAAALHDDIHGGIEPDNWLSGHPLDCGCAAVAEHEALDWAEDHQTHYSDDIRWTAWRHAFERTEGSRPKPYSAFYEIQPIYLDGLYVPISAFTYAGDGGATGGTR